MKIQLIFLAVCVVASFAFPDKSELNGLGEQKQEHVNTSQGLAHVDDEQTDSQEENLDEKTISSNKTEGRKHNDWISRRHNRRNWLRREKETPGINSGTVHLNDGESRQRDNSLLPHDESNMKQDGHHRHSHRHRHHRHRSDTTTLPPLNTTTASSAPLAQPYQPIRLPS